MDVSVVQERLKAAHGDTVTIVGSTYVGFKKRATFIDKEFGRWDALVYAVCRGGRHPERFRTTKRITLAEAQRRLFERHGDAIKIKSGTWVRSSDRCTFIDVEFGEFDNHLCNVLNGVGHPVRTRLHRSESQKLTADELNLRLMTAHSGTVELVGPYVNMGQPCVFRDVKFGEFTALPLNVCRGTGHIKRAAERRRQTSIKHFGVPHHLQNDEQFQKAWKARFAQYREPHWKTGESLLCTARWELATVKWFNEKKIDFIWQPQAFRMPDGHTYRPDAFVIDMNLWIDVKGFFPEASRRKCEWFKGIMPNFEVWNKERLLELGILER